MGITLQGHPGQDTKARLSPQEVEAGKLAIENAQGCSSPLSGRSPKKGAEGTSTSLIFLEQLNSPTSSTNRIHPCKAGLPLFPFRAAARLSIWSYDATDTNCNGLVSFCAESKFYRAGGKGVRESRGWGGGGLGRKEES